MKAYLSLSGLLGVDDTVEAVSEDADTNHLNKRTKGMAINRSALNIKSTITGSEKNLTFPDVSPFGCLD